MTKAVITGITGQDGSYLAELLLQKGYEVHGIVRRAGTTSPPRPMQMSADGQADGERLFLHYCDLDDATTLRRLLVSIQPAELYHLAGQSHVGLSFEIPEATCRFTATGTLQLLEIVRDLPQPPRFLHVGSSELFGHADASPQNEDTPFRPITPYGVAKAFGANMVRVYRQAFGLFCVNAICYNHESPRRGEAFVTRKITKAAARIAVEGGPKLQLGAIDATRDWGFAPEYVEAMWRMMTAETAQDLVLATGVSTSVGAFVEHAFTHAGLDWREHVELDTRFLRPADAAALVGDARRAEATLGWRAKTDVATLAQIMVDADLAVLRG